MSTSPSGRVVFAKRNVDGSSVAIKIIPMTESTSSLSKEVDVLKSFKSMFLVRYDDVFVNGNEIWVQNRSFH